MAKQIIDEYEARKYIDNRKEYYIERLGYDIEKAEESAYCDLQAINSLRLLLRTERKQLK